MKEPYLVCVNFQGFLEVWHFNKIFGIWNREFGHSDITINEKLVGAFYDKERMLIGPEILGHEIIDRWDE